MTVEKYCKSDIMVPLGTFRSGRIYLFQEFKKY